MQRFVLYLAGSVFLLVAVAHIVRLLLGVQILIQGWVVPLWISAIAAAITVVLGWLCLRVAGR